MAELTPLDEKLGEVLGLAQAAQRATQHVAKMEGADDYATDLERMGAESAEAERRTDALVDGLEGRKTAIREKAAETKSEAIQMMETYLGGEEEALDGFEFLSMTEAGETCHWEIVETMAGELGLGEVRELGQWAVATQRGHAEAVRRASLALAREEAAEQKAG